MKAILPWIRTIVSIPAGLFALQMFHMLMMRIVPQYYSMLGNDQERFGFLVLCTLAGIVASFVVIAIARHRYWLHVLAFLAICLLIDYFAVNREFLLQPEWFKSALLLLVPVQVWIGGALGRRTWKTVSPASSQ